MNALRILLLSTLGFVGASLANASPPAQVGGTFVFFSYGVGTFNSSLYFLGTDGTCKQLSDFSHVSTFVSYFPSVEGTYTYALTPGNPNEATLTLNNVSRSGASTLEFTGDTGGYFQGLGPSGSSFTFLLPSQNTFLANVSSRVTLRPGDTAISGFVIQGAASRLVLIRAVGPSLATFGVSPVSAHPQLQLFSGIGTNSIGSAQAWSLFTDPSGYYQFDAQAMSWIFRIAGAFQLNAGSNDVVYFGLLSPGTYTAQGTDPAVGTGGGSALMEVYIFPFSS